MQGRREIQTECASPRPHFWQRLPRFAAVRTFFLVFLSD